MEGWMGNRLILQVTHRTSFCWKSSKLRQFYLYWRPQACRRCGLFVAIWYQAVFTRRPLLLLLITRPTPPPPALLTLRCMRHPQSWRPSLRPTSLHSSTPKPGFTICFGSPPFCRLSPPWSSCVLSTVQPPSSFVRPRPALPIVPRAPPISALPLPSDPSVLTSTVSPQSPADRGLGRGPPNLLVLLLTAAPLLLSSFKVFSLLFPFGVANNCCQQAPHKIPAWWLLWGRQWHTGCNGCEQQKGLCPVSNVYARLALTQINLAATSPHSKPHVRHFPRDSGPAVWIFWLSLGFFQSPNFAFINFPIHCGRYRPATRTHAPPVDTH